MIAEYRTSNCLSFGGTAEFSMLATSDTTRQAENTFTQDKHRFLKSAAIYGANGSGKSNFVSTFIYMRGLVLENTEIEDRSYKLDKSLSGKPSSFEVSFYNTDQKRYRYGFEVDGEEIVSEWLFYVPSSREALLFTREKEVITLGGKFKEGKGLEAKVSNSRLFLSVVAELNGEISKFVVSWFKNVHVLNGLTSSYNTTLNLIEKMGDQYKARVLGILHSFDIQMEDFIIRERASSPIALPENAKVSEGLRNVLEAMNTFMKEEDIKPIPQVITVRKNYEDGKEVGVTELDLLENESDGTQKLFALAGRLVQALDEGQTLIIDELESKLHPLITKEIVNIFNSSDRNKKNAQLVFTTHDTNLLTGGHLRRDQIWFTEKDKCGQSHLYSLVEYKQKPRKDASFEKDYVHGRYGAIPFIGDFAELLGK